MIVRKISIVSVMVIVRTTFFNTVNTLFIPASSPFFPYMFQTNSKHGYGCPSHFCDVFDRCLQESPEARPTFKEIGELLVTQVGLFLSLGRYTQIHTSTVVQGGAGWMELLPGVFDMLQYFETILPLVESL